MAENRRVRMTKRLMKDALLELMETKPFEKIKVTDVCAAADVNRSTFYAYYTDTLALLGEIEDDVIAASPAAAEGESGGEGGFLRDLSDYFEFVRQNERVFRLLLLRRSSEEFNRRLIDSVMERCRPLAGEGAGRWTYVFCVSGVIGLLREWISGGFSLTSGEFAGRVFALCSAAAGA